MSAPQSVADSVLGLTQSELLLFRQQQQILAQQSHQGGMRDRGRGTSRQSQPSSRAASAASSQGVPGRIMLDPHSLQTLSLHLENVLRNIQRRIGELEDATEQSVRNSNSRASGAMQDANSEITRMRRILAEIGALEDEFETIKRIRDKIRQIRNNVDGLSDRLDRSRPSGPGPGARPRR
ncbi:uncharacterized protein Z518_01200 [Rhinocladiella mackenziei CBS 650.93]|uniref:Biogenesis of lysosome-related organelles complex 1 subunit CNL1 n=1 Tax=Rhinocladiella mackenziei CBS 650.93 TaxID=1442369 RepID=A0A0D2IVQ2_9EURO|nr:uncharacterized protein Z518_01200 [Rhinocladiella mackenziei CBS 650.93]KIX10119.1 hypothetical protein Z518_01200 [Rhinocladiella mackenziei CBS 650.93]